MTKKKSGCAQKGEAENPHRPADPEAEEEKRLRALALSRKLLRLGAPPKPSAPLPPSKAVVKLQGRDITRRGQRKSRYLFSFPGLLAPISGGRIGELADLGTKNPILYVEFPQGRMKLFGTHVYPKNKYLTLQLSKSSKGVMCEDVFESMIVFSDAWWVGQKEDNPQELQLEFPNFTEGKDATEYDFKGGAGAMAEEQVVNTIPGKDSREPFSPDIELEDDLPEDSYTEAEHKAKNMTESTPVRQSARTAGKKLSYAESSGDDSSPNDAEVPHMMHEKMEHSCPASSSVVAPEDEQVKRKFCKAKTGQSSLSVKETKEQLSEKKGSLVQATLSTLFEKVADKKSKRKAQGSPETKGPVNKRQRSCSKQQVQAEGCNSKKKDLKSSLKKNGSQAVTKEPYKVVDEPEEISSDSQDDSDEDWIA